MLNNLLLCVGAQKSGTTWLYAQLENHPEISFSDVKEIHYFNTIHNGSLLLSSRKVEHLKRLITNNRGALERYFTNLSRGKEVDQGIKKLLSPVDDAWYINTFPKNNKKYAADFSPEYALLPKEGFDNVKRVSANQKIIFLMRDPVSRTKSAIQYYFQTQGIDASTVSSEMIHNVASKDFIFNLSAYDKTVRMLKSEFHSSQVKFMFFEHIMKDKKKALDEICEFLEIATMNVEAEKADERVNSSKQIEFPAGFDEQVRHKLATTYEYMYSEFDNIPDKWCKPWRLL